MLKCNMCESMADWGYCQEHEENNVNELTAYADALVASREQLAQKEARIRELEEEIFTMEKEINGRISSLNKERGELEKCDWLGRAKLKAAINELCDLHQTFISEIKALSDKSNQSDKEDGDE